jgi:outer membrane protein OmpA-like peptidoglycan-associated protein
LEQPYQAVHLERADVAPSAPFTINQQEVRRTFGSLLDALPPAEVSFLLYFSQASDSLTAESRGTLPRIFEAIRERHSTAISVIGHTDTTGSAQTNYQLGLRRAQAVVEILRQQGAADADFTVESHGDADLLVKTGPGVDEPRNRRVEVIVR